MTLPSVVGWRADDVVGGEATYFYRVQVDDIDLRSKEKIIRDFEGWRPSGEIYESTGSFGMIFVRSFSSEKEWVRWAKTFIYPLKELNRKNNIKRDFCKGKKKKKVNSKKQKHRLCSVCDKRGHNSRTCPNR